MVPLVATGLFPGDAGASARAALATLTNSGTGNAGAGASRMADGPTSHWSIRHEKRPATSKLRRCTIVVLEALPHCPDEPALRAVKYEGLQPLMKANGIPCGKNIGVPEFLTAVLAWLCAHPDDELCLPPGLLHCAARSDGRTPTPAGAAPSSRASPEHLFGPPSLGHSPPPAPSPHDHSADPPGASVPGVQHAATML